jgi:hypothetical protein
MKDSEEYAVVTGYVPGVGMDNICVCGHAEILHLEDSGRPCTYSDFATTSGQDGHEVEYWCTCKEFKSRK